MSGIQILSPVLDLIVRFSLFDFLIRLQLIQSLRHASAAAVAEPPLLAAAAASPLFGHRILWALSGEEVSVD